MSPFPGIFLLFFFTCAYGQPQRRECQTRKSQKRWMEPPGTNGTVYRLNQHFYEVALKKKELPSNINVTTSELYIHELVCRALTRCDRLKGSYGYRKYRRQSYTNFFRNKHRRQNRRRSSRCGYWERKEVRVMSAAEWERFVDRLNILKSPIYTKEGISFIPYDIISDVHMPERNIEAAHFGPNFLSWHRIYLLVLESALNVPVPYWNSRLDFDMRDPTKSILWTPRYFGTGNGFVNNGPFSTWITPDGFSLIRNIGNSGTLITENQIETLMEFKSHAPVVEPSYNLTIEMVHNGVHVWVDGQLSSPRTASQDPVFFMHHAFVDYIWYLFRKNMKKGQNGVDPETDYILNSLGNFNVSKLQFPDENMIPFNSGLKNIDGYKNAIESLTTYQPSPKCPCNSINRKPSFLFCNKTTKRCQSIEAPEPEHKVLIGAASTQILRTESRPTIRLGKRFEIRGLKVDPRTRNDTIRTLPLTQRNPR